jgi:hypothetical protein
MKTIGSAALASLAFQSTQATLGVDVSAKVSNWGCLKQAGYDFAIPRAWCSYGGIDANINSNIANAHAAGFKYVDVYMFPCRGKSAADQVNGLVNSVSAQNPGFREVSDVVNEEESAEGLDAGWYEDVSDNETIADESSGEHQMWRIENGVPQHQLESGYGMVWIDVEDNPSTGCSWKGHSAADNCNFLMQLINGLKSKGKNVGVYTSQYEW